jgi:GT2 family glycosyltransferase/2-polyprenyl-3-methyl-5-hydroxy-6-metoxy-1,4-benzoquinol methylase/glycosyltransferase involved in cell wall biosynthesis/archaellum component FlaC
LEAGVDSTGERFLPQEADPFDELAVEHQQRYRSVKNLVAGKIVLDAGCGEGYGTGLLAGSAARVAGVDISTEAAAHARGAYKRQNLEYLVGSVSALPFQAGSFDVVVCFEVIEHLDEDHQCAFLREARRVLNAEGILVISTPNKKVYTDLTGRHNRFHKKEFHVDEFESFLRSAFPHVLLFGQSWFISSVLDKPSSHHLANLKPAESAPFNPKYVVAVCGASAIDGALDLSSVVVDQRAKLEGMRARIVELQDEVAARNTWVQSVKQDLQSTEKALAHYKREAEELRREVTDVRAHLSESEQRVRDQASAITGLERRITELNSDIGSMQRIMRGREADLALLRTELEEIKRSDFWKVASLYWRVRDSVLPVGSGRRRNVKSAFRLLKNGLQLPRHWLGRETPTAGQETQADAKAQATGAAEAAGTPEEPFEFPGADQPKVSVIIPVFNQWAYTYRCVKSIQQTLAGMACEVILADDGSTDATQRAGEIVVGVRVVRGAKNRGFLRNCNWAAGHARGSYLYFLNNDTELQLGAIHALVSLLDSDPTIGMVGSKLVYPDGRLQEAGGIIWADGSGWNFGRGQNPGLPAFNYVKEVDYVSGASFMIRKELWNAIGGFDERYEPAYCEDSDLAFEVRKRGFKVVYQPQSVVIHFEGASHGTDVAQSTKAHQVTNTEALKAKWKEALAAQFPNGTNVFQARDRSAGRKTILMIDHYVPQFDRDAGSRTIWSFIQAFHRMGLNVKFLGDNFYPHQPYTDMLQQAGVEVLTGPWFADHWPEWLEENGPFLDYVFLNRPHIAPKYLGPIKTHTKARVLYYVHDLHYLRESKLADLTNDASLKERVERSKRDEQQLMSRMDVIFSCSDSETEIIRELCPAAEVFYVPAYSVEVDLAREYRPQERADLLFVGGFSHPPNIDGILWFVREVWPDVRRKLPGVIFKIAGSNPPSKLRALATDDVNVLGFVSDDRLEELYQTSRLAVIPLRYGGGVKGKTVEAMAHGVPVVCTEYGVEGMPGIIKVIDPMQVSASLADGIVGLYNDFSRLAGISNKERGYVAHHFNLEKIQESFAQAIVMPVPVLRAGFK